MIPAALAVPGDITTVTGGYIYDRRLLEELRHAGRTMRLIPLSDSFPFPTAADMAADLALLQAIPPDCPVMIDGLAFGAMDRAGVAAIAAPIVALVHHPLALETGLAPAEAARLFETERANLRHAAEVVVPSPHTAALLAERYGVPVQRLHVARPGTQPPRANPPRQLVTPPLILSVGILHPRKGHDVLIAALARIADLDWQAQIVGTPWQAGHSDSLRQQISALGLASRVRLAEAVPAEALARLYAEASVFALATRHEGYGIVFNEALAHGLPIVSCRTGAVPDTVPGDAGILVPCDDAAAFAGALRALLTDQGLRTALSDAASRHGATLSDWAETARIAGRALDAAARGAA